MFQCYPPIKVVFEGHSTTETRAIVYVKSLVKVPLLVKVRTTTPHKFSVLPHTTILEPDTTIPLKIVLHPFVTRPGRTGTKADKFLIQVRLFLSNSNPTWNSTELELVRVGVVVKLQPNLELN